MLDSFISWWKNPLGNASGGPSAGNLFLVIGLILVFLVAWGIIFAHIREAV